MSTHVTITTQLAAEGFIAVGMDEEVYIGRGATLFVVTVPLRLPADTPRMEHRADRIIYNYNDYVVEARFLEDGSVDVVYNSGLLRPLPFN